MDANGLRFWQAASAADFRIDRATNLHWRADERLLRLDRQQDAVGLAEDGVFSRALANKPSPVADSGGGYAWWDSASGALRAAGFGEGAINIALPPENPPGVTQPTDLAFGEDDVLYVARNDGVVMIDRRERWTPARVGLAGFKAQRLAPAPGGGVWALDRVDGRLARLTGRPLRKAGFVAETGERFKPVEPNPKPPGLRVIRSARLPASVEAMALAASQGGRLAVLAWVAGADAALFTLEDRKFLRRFALDGLRFPYGLAWVGEDRVAVVASDGAEPAKQAFVYELDAPAGETASARPTGEIFRLIAPWHGNFCNLLADAPQYPIAGANVDAPGGLRRLRPLSRATYARRGHVAIGPFDSGRNGHVWHRLFIEASIPERCGIRIWMRASNAPAEPAPPGAANAPSWSPHVVGAAGTPGTPDAPAASWCDEASELPFHPGLLTCAKTPGRAGLFTALVQRAGTKVRRIEGRWLWLFVELLGDGQATPEVAAIRVNGERFAYRDHYLPAFHNETLAGADGETKDKATPPDFMDRFLGLFEGPLTQIEGKVAESWLLTDPASTPDAALPWLGNWIGITAQDGEAPSILRQKLRAAPWTARLHGSLGGLLAALELETGGQLVTGGRVDPFRLAPRPGKIAYASLGDAVIRALVLSVSDPAAGQPLAILTGGAVTRGEIVVVEGWRLRRTFATILGADLADENDPLTLGLATSGNSFVGDSLILGEEAQSEILALFAPELSRDGADGEAASAFFERLAHRVLVLIRETERTKARRRLAEAAAAASPAHVEVSFFDARQPLIVAAASLVGLDTFLLPEPEPQTARVGRSQIGAGDRVRGSGRLDPRADGPPARRPVAVAEGPQTVFAGANFILSAARSESAEGRSIVRNIWTWL